MPAPVFHHEIENKPLRAERGRLEIKGWCLATGSPLPPAVRLTLNDREHFAIARRIARADVVRTDRKSVV